MPKTTVSLSRKFALGTAAGLLASSLVFLILFVGLFRQQLEEQRADAATQVSQLLRISLENAMLRHDLDGLREIVQGLGRQPSVASVAITNPQGEIRFASDPQRLGLHLAPGADRHSPDPDGGGPDGRPVLRSINPVRNRPACQECHGPTTEHPINGIIYVDFDADSIRHQARHTTLLLMGAGSLIVLLNLAGGWWFMGRYVLRPVAHLAEASARLSEGDLSVRTSLTGNDELSRPGQDHQPHGRDPGAQDGRAGGEGAVPPAVGGRLPGWGAGDRPGLPGPAHQRRLSAPTRPADDNGARIWAYAGPGAGRGTRPQGPLLCPDPRPGRPLP